MSKNNNQYAVFQTIRRGKNNDGVCFQLTATSSGDVLITLARQKGVVNNLPEFDYQNSLKTGFSDLEASKISLMIQRQLMSGGFEAKLDFPHLNAVVPKNIQLKFTKYNEKPQCSFAIYPQNQNAKPAIIYLTEEEMYILKINLDKQISVYDKKNMIEIIDTRKFKEYMAEQK